MNQMKCRVLDLPPQNGVDNIATEAALLDCVGEDFTVVFTNWEPSVLVGNSQSIALDIDQEACRRNKIPIVRRFSGGQAVYIDKNYLVFSVMGSRNAFPQDLHRLRRQLCDVAVRALQKFGVPASFYKPDNVVIASPRLRTLGNSGQIIRAKVVAVEASVRYDLPDESLRSMLEVLKTNGHSLRGFTAEVRNALASVREFSGVSLDELKEALLEGVLRVYRCASFYRDTLHQEELARTEQIRAELLDARIADKERYASRGVCYFYLNGSCIIPEIANFLPYNKPSTHTDSTITT